jgi:Flp pilus assembly protein TadG
MKLLKFNPRKSKAQAIVEFAIVLPILLLVVYGLIEAGRLLFIYSSVNNATRQAARWGSTSGVSGAGVPRYQDCAGIRAAAQGGDFLDTFDDADIVISYDNGPGTTSYDTCDGTTDTNVDPAQGDRVVVTVDADYNTIVPNIVPFISRTVAGGNPIVAESSRTLILSVSITPPKETTTTLITSDAPDPSLVNAYVTVSVTVTSKTIPTGTVTITGADENCTIPTLDGSGSGSCNVRFTSIGDKTLTATYNGDAKHNPSTDTESHRVKAPSTTTITTSPNPSLINTSVNVTVSVTSAWGTPTGTVNVTFGGVDLCPPITLVNGTGSCSPNPTFNAEGDKLLTAEYLGDDSFFGSTDTKLHTVILPGETRTNITILPSPSIVGQPVTVSVTVTSTDTPTGSVTVTGGGLSCTITLVNGAGSCPPYTFNTVGTYPITASYTPDTPEFLPSSATRSHEVSLSPTTIIVEGDTPDPSEVGQTVTVTVRVTGGITTPTGTVTITGADTNCNITLSGGTGSCSVIFNNATPPTKTITATYLGDASHAGSTATASHTVNPAVVVGCNTTNITVGLLRQTNGALTMTITNNLTQFVQIGAVNVVWNHDKGHQTGDDKTLRLLSASLGSVFWTENPPGQPGPSYPITPTSPIFIPPGTSTIVFNFHQTFDRWDDTERVTISLSSPGCDGVILDQNRNEAQK